MTETVVVMVTVSERVESLNRFLRTYATHGPGYPIHIHLQDPDLRWREIEVPKSVGYSMQISPFPIGCHAARVLALRHISQDRFDHYVNVDDDVLITPTTDYPSAVRYSDLPGVGFVLTNWAMHLSQYRDKAAKINPVFSPQIMVYQGGGMAYAEPTAELMRALDPVPARFDDIWPLTTYLNGYSNYRYSGSLSVHLIRSKGGMSRYMRSTPRPLLCQEWIDYRPIPGARVGVDYAIPMDSDLKQAARDKHVASRIAQGWPMRTPKFDAHPPSTLPEPITQPIQPIVTP